MSSLRVRPLDAEMAALVAQRLAGLGRSSGGWVPSVASSADQFADPVTGATTMQHRPATGQSGATGGSGASVPTPEGVETGHGAPGVVSGGGGSGAPAWTLTARSAALIAVACAMGVILAAALLWLARPQEDTVVLQPTLISEGTPVAAGRATASTTPSRHAGTSAGDVVVHVAGRVRRPGVVRLAGGSRVVDALQAAGGPTKRADLAAVNLARPVVDGEQVLVPDVGATTGSSTTGTPTAGSPANGTTTGGSASSGVPGGRTSGPGVGQPLDLNAATAADLERLPGVGPVLASRIIAWRAEHGRFASLEQLTEVRGIGPAVLAGLVDLVRV